MRISENKIRISYIFCKKLLGRILLFIKIKHIFMRERKKSTAFLCVAGRSTCLNTMLRVYILADLLMNSAILIRKIIIILIIIKEIL